MRCNFVYNHIVTMYKITCVTPSVIKWADVPLWIAPIMWNYQVHIPLPVDKCYRVVMLKPHTSSNSVHLVNCNGNNSRCNFSVHVPFQNLRIFKFHLFVANFQHFSFCHIYCPTQIVYNASIILQKFRRHIMHCIRKLNAWFWYFRKGPNDLNWNKDNFFDKWLQGCLKLYSQWMTVKMLKS